MKLGVLQPNLRKLYQDLDKCILTPRLERQASSSGSLHINGNDIWTSQNLPDTSLQALFSDIRLMIDFLRARLPNVVVKPLSEMLMPNLISKVISIWLSSAIPTELDGMHEFQGTIDSILHFGEHIQSYEWPGTDDLVTWTNDVPKIWLDKRRHTSLDSVRKLLAKGLGKIATVERVETQVLSRHDDVLANGGVNDDWNAGWSDEESKDSSKLTAEQGGNDGEEEDVSAWGLDDESQNQGPHEAQKQAHAANDEADAWGWGDDDIDEALDPGNSASKGMQKNTINGDSDTPASAERAVTLKETYNITSLPSEVLDIIETVIHDAEKLRKPKWVMYQSINSFTS